MGRAAGAQVGAPLLRSQDPKWPCRGVCPRPAAQARSGGPREKLLTVSTSHSLPHLGGREGSKRPSCRTGAGAWAWLLRGRDSAEGPAVASRAQASGWRVPPGLSPPGAEWGPAQSDRPGPACTGEAGAPQGSARDLGGAPVCRGVWYRTPEQLKAVGSRTALLSPKLQSLPDRQDGQGQGSPVGTPKLRRGPRPPTGPAAAGDTGQAHREAWPPVGPPGQGHAETSLRALRGRPGRGGSPPAHINFSSILKAS